METLHPHQLLIDKYWVGHSEIDVNRSLLTSSTLFLIQITTTTK